MPIAPSTYYAAKSRPPAARSLSDQEIEVEIQRVVDANFRVYGASKVWRQLRREDYQVARCTVERLMRKRGLQGAVRGKKRFTDAVHREAEELVSAVLVRMTEAETEALLLGLQAFLRVLHAPSPDGASPALPVHDHGFSTERNP